MAFNALTLNGKLKFTTGQQVVDLVLVITQSTMVFGAIVQMTQTMSGRRKRQAQEYGNKPHYQFLFYVTHSNHSVNLMC
ncbi:hypothetical protein TUM4438_03300 [Shewanella sairae]|uniref:Uncharacterized protein n=1 Tax=Shewanella sairae TaxID=190310 RepID=A0ABQ4P0B3_9GAMM|nr:hypothetical protein TUM4438_03300 [Shewanella sairae]